MASMSCSRPLRSHGDLFCFPPPPPTVPVVAFWAAPVVDFVLEAAEDTLLVAVDITLPAAGFFAAVFFAGAGAFFTVVVVATLAFGFAVLIEPLPLPLLLVDEELLLLPLVLVAFETTGGALGCSILARFTMGSFCTKYRWT